MSRAWSVRQGEVRVVTTHEASRVAPVRVAAASGMPDTGQRPVRAAVPQKAHDTYWH